MKVSEFDYYLPEELIAQKPTEKRDQSRLMLINKKERTIEHKHFYDIVEHLNEGDCLVLNNSKVIPARIFGVKESTGAKIEFLLIKSLDGDCWETMVKPGKRLRDGDFVIFPSGVKAEILGSLSQETRKVRFTYDGIFMEKLEEIGTMPLPPYIHREGQGSDRDRYQTIYARPEGSVAAPTAGLHFTAEILNKLAKKGVKLAYLTLHVGIGTFKPVTSTTVEDHHMHFEEYDISEAAAKTINNTRATGGRVIAVGTTSTRTLESGSDKNGKVIAGNGRTEIFIYPGYKFKVVDGLITNFHLPKSTLMMLISAFYDREEIMKAYEVAKKEKYRFFSYGDAMFITENTSMCCKGVL